MKPESCTKLKASPPATPSPLSNLDKVTLARLFFAWQLDLSHGELRALETRVQSLGGKPFPERAELEKAAEDLVSAARVAR